LFCGQLPPQVSLGSVELPSATQLATSAHKTTTNRSLLITVLFGVLILCSQAQRNPKVEFFGRLRSGTPRIPLRAAPLPSVETSMVLINKGIDIAWKVLTVLDVYERAKPYVTWAHSKLMDWSAKIIAECTKKNPGNTKAINQCVIDKVDSIFG